MNIIISKSDKPDKKYKIVLDGKKTIYIGQAGASDYLQHKDEERKQRYINRHKKREEHLWNDPSTPAYWSRWLTWEKTNIKDAINNINK